VPWSEKATRNYVQWTGIFTPALTTCLLKGKEHEQNVIIVAISVFCDRLHG
jgi:hypothetical protein